jgi:hypothetical protein
LAGSETQDFPQTVSSRMQIQFFGENKIYNIFTFQGAISLFYSSIQDFQATGEAFSPSKLL